jgi:hypothetical protein
MSADTLAIVALPEPATAELQPDAEPLESLRHLIADGLAHQESLGRSLASTLMDAMECSIRVGWYADDARTFLAAEGTYLQWVETHFPQAAYRRLCELRRLSRCFCRDIVDAEQRRRLGIQVVGLPAVAGQHLRTQLSQLGEIRNMTQLLRACNVLPERTANGNGSHARGDLRGIATALQKRLNHLNPAKLSDEQRAQLRRALQPIAEYLHAIT